VLRTLRHAATAVAAVVLVLLLAGPALACPDPTSPVAGRVRAFVAKREGTYATAAQRDYAAAAAASRPGRLVEGAPVRTLGALGPAAAVAPLAAGPRQCGEDVEEAGRRKLSYCLKIYGSYPFVYGAVDLHAWGWRDGVGWITLRFDSQTLNYTKLWHDQDGLPGPEPLFSFGQSAAQYGCSLGPGQPSSGCSIPNSTSFTLYSIGYGVDTPCVHEVWSTGNYTDLSWRSDTHTSHFVPRFTWRSPWDGF
jgi:hypothetical protein